MPKSCQGRRTRRLILIAAALGLAAAPAQASGAAEGLYYERSLMLAAHARCGLFSAAEAGALAAGAAQARGAALRGGAAEATLAAARGRAEARARATDCRSTDLATAAGRVRQAFAGWARTPRMTFPGDDAAWAADRYRRAPWRLIQSPAGDEAGAVAVAAGLSSDAPGLFTAAATFPAGQTPSTARLVLRDPRRSVGPWLARPGVAATPPRSASRVFLASAREAAGEGLLPPRARGGLAFRFPAEAAEAIAALDPRERFLVEFVFPDARVRTVRLEVGDFAAGRAFVAMGEL